MYYLAGRDAALAGLRAIAGNRQADLDDLRVPYRDWLGRRQPTVTIGGDITLRRTEFCDDPELKRAIIQLNTGHAESHADLAPEIFDAGTVRRRIAALEGALERLREVDTDVVDLFELVVNRVFVGGDNAVAGSTSSSIGVTWATLPNDYPSGDLVEFLVHEFTHHLLFIDDAMFQHYTDPQGAATRGLTLSPVRGVLRPLIFVLHSLVVAVEILKLRRGPVGTMPTTNFFHPDTQHLHDSCVACVRSIEASVESLSLLSPRGLALFNICRASLELHSPRPRPADSPRSER
ncbi:MAG: hypothetical protein JO246_14555 [Frankiaceae bacterium]|nr:hypothetical protein [Frankiaceae bacterium]MBV9869586.1 hypothetical protein [Frankiaceae bacterium]